MFVRPWTWCSVLVAMAPATAVAAPIESQPDTVGGTPTQAITWTDAHGEPRTVHVLTDNHRIIRYTYTVDGAEVVDDEVPSYGIGNFVNHGSCGAVTTWEGEADYSAQVVLAGPHHYIWRSTFRFFMCDHPDVAWRVTNEYLFVTGEDAFIQTATYDSSDLPADQPMGDDMRGPYNQTTWPGDGDISGFGWGSQYRFQTTGPIPDGDANVGGGVAAPWAWTEQNTIPYVWEWADPAQGGAVDREYGMVQNQPYAEQDFGGGFYGCGGDCFASPPPLSGAALPASWAMPSQMSAYDSNYRSGRITWGATYGTFENGHANDTGSIPNMGDHFRPINAWSWTHVVGKHSEGGLLARVTDTEHAYATTLTATTGTVVTSGPRGPGDFVGPTVGRMPTIEWSNPGFDFIHRTWNVTADQGAIAVTMDVAQGGLVRPVLVAHDYAGEDEVVRLDGEELAADADYYASYDPATARLWITIDRTLEGGSHTIVIGPAGGELPPDDGGATDDGATGGGATGSIDDSGGGSGAEAGDSGAGGDGTSAGADGGDGGAGGCGCRATSRTGPPVLVLGLLAIPALRRRRARARACT
jgi:MYXO-CTERM domain-containing protein